VKPVKSEVPLPLGLVTNGSPVALERLSTLSFLRSTKGAHAPSRVCELVAASKTVFVECSRSFARAIGLLGRRTDS